MEKCQCRPHYFPQYKDYGNCTFGMHTICISPSLNTFNFTKCVNCPVECEKNRCEFPSGYFYKDLFSYIRNIEFKEYHQAVSDTLEKFRRQTGSSDIDLTGIQVK